MSILDRAKNVILKPTEEWSIISRETGTIGGLFGSYAAILAAIPMAAGILFTGALGISGAGLLGGGAIPLGFEAIAAMSVIGYILSLITLYLMGIIVNSVSPSFNGKSDLHQSLKLLTYASTPTWLAGLVSWIPILGALVSFAANVYVVYLIYLGLQPVLGVPKEKVAGFTVVIVLIYVVLSLIVSGIIIGLLFSTFFAGGATGVLSGA